LVQLFETGREYRFWLKLVRHGKLLLFGDDRRKIKFRRDTVEVGKTNRRYPVSAMYSEDMIAIPA
jgi:hypothetical protein